MVNLSTLSSGKCPEEGHYKLNIDASVFSGTNSFSIGMILRDHNGMFLRGKMARFSGRVLAFEAEVVGILEAPSWIYTAPSQRVTVETDSLMVVNTL